MKSFIIQFPKKTEDNSGVFKKALLNRIWNKYPWLTDDSTSAFTLNGKDISYAGPEDGFHIGKKHSAFDVNFSAKDYINDLKAKKANNDIYRFYDNISDNYYNNDDPDVYDLYNNFSETLLNLDRYAKRRKLEKTYDFLTPDGTGVNVLDGFIQIGSEIIPRSAGVVFFSRMPKVKRVTVMKVMVSVNSYLVAA